MTKETDNYNSPTNYFETLPPKSRGELMSIMEEVKYPRGYLLMESGKVEPNIYIIKKGIVRAYSYNEDKEITFWFGQEGDLVISINGYINNKSGYENIELLEDSEFYKFKNIDLQKLYKKDINIANWGRKQAELGFITTEQRLINRLTKSATQNYLDLLRTDSTLINRVKLSHIASFLGITQVSLSRIRANI